MWKVLAALLFLMEGSIVALSVEAAARDTPSSPYVCSRSGGVYGITITVQGRNLNAFYGIPFAEPPVGPLRYKKPVPKSPWVTPLNATGKRPSCIQFTKQSEVIGKFAPDNSTSEDCLHLNIWAPANGKFKAVIFFLYGGGFIWGSNRLVYHDARYLAALGDVLVVVPNYRVGVLGFLNGRIEDIPGNAGIWDVILALQWVKKNVKKFGGDPDSITVMGESAGAVITGLLMISPVSDRLFHRAIMQGGSPFWYFRNITGLGPSTVEKVAQRLNCGVSFAENPAAVVRCLRDAPVTEIVNKTTGIFGTVPYQLFPSDSDGLFPEPHIPMIKKGRIHGVDLLIGTTVDEGAFFALPTLKWLLGKDYAQNVNKTHIMSVFSIYIRLTLGFDPTEMTQLYFADVEETDKLGILKAAVKLMGDYAISCPVLYLVDEVGGDCNNDVFVYEFSHRPANSLWPPWVRATHTQDLEFTLGSLFHFPKNFSSGDRRLSIHMIDTWSSFAKTGKPGFLQGVKWERYTPFSKTQLVIGKDGPSVAVDFHQRECKTLYKYIDRYNRGVSPS